VAIKGLKAFALALRVEALIGFEILASPICNQILYIASYRR